MKTVAITGATGFVGSHVLSRLIASGYSVRALKRQASIPPILKEALWIAGTLSDTPSLIELCTGADTLIHSAGVIKAKREADFIAGNVKGTENLIAAAKQAGVRSIIYVSSITAREPTLSYYASSKAQAEHLVEASGIDFTNLRLTAVYGPGDSETLSFFKAAQGLLLPISNPQAKLSLIHVDDTASAIVAACNNATIGQTIELCDGTVLTQRALAEAIATSVAGNPRIFALPRSLAWCAGGISEIVSSLTGKTPMLTRQKVAELYHDDWSTTDTQLTQRTGWQPGIDLTSGLMQTCRWYKAHGWL